MSLLSLRIEIDEDPIHPLDNEYSQPGIIYKGIRPKCGRLSTATWRPKPLDSLLFSNDYRYAERLWRVDEYRKTKVDEHKVDEWSEAITRKHLDKLKIDILKFSYGGCSGVMFYLPGATKELFGGDRDAALTSMKILERNLRAWESGECYGWLIDKEGEGTVESCWGYYSYEECSQAGNEALNHLQEEEQKEIMESLLV